VLQRVAPASTSSAGEEVRLRIYEELDYELEAQNQRSLRDLPPHPFIVVPTW